MSKSPRLNRLKAFWRWANRYEYASQIRTMAQWLVFAVIVGYLAYQFTSIGWGNVWNSLPTTPWFYVLSLVLYAMLPVVEGFIYGRLWGMPVLESLPILFRKRVYNHDVVGYSGEFYLAWWGQRHAPVSRSEALAGVKDNTIISGITSTAVAVVLLAVFVLFDQITLLESYLPDRTTTWLGIGGLVLVIGGIGVALRRYIFSLDPWTLGFLGGVHTARFIVFNVVQVIQWMVVLPEVSIGSWITLIALFIVINQLPFLPSRDLIFMGAGVELSSLLAISPAAVAGMLLVKSAIDKSLNILVYLGTGIRSTADVSPSEREEAPISEPDPSDEPVQGTMEL